MDFVAIEFDDIHEGMNVLVITDDGCGVTGKAYGINNDYKHGYMLEMSCGIGKPLLCIPTSIIEKVLVHLQ